MRMGHFGNKGSKHRNIASVSSHVSDTLEGRYRILPGVSHTTHREGEEVRKKIKERRKVGREGEGENRKKEKKS